MDSVVWVAESGEGVLTLPASLHHDIAQNAVSVTESGEVDIRLPGKGNSNSRGARPVYSFR